MAHNGPRIPLHMQHPDIAKAAKKGASYESFGPHKRHEVAYKVQGNDRPSTHAMSVVRRNPDGTLDYQWAKNAVIDAIHNLHYEHALRPIDMALVSIIFPDKYRKMEPAQAEILTQFSASEKKKVRQAVEQQLLEEENWNAGRGGGSVDGRARHRNGVP